MWHVARGADQANRAFLNPGTRHFTHPLRPHLSLLRVLCSQQLLQHEAQVLLGSSPKLLPVQQHQRVQPTAGSTLLRQRPNRQAAAAAAAG